MKKMLALLLALAMPLGLCACGGQTPASRNTLLTDAAQETLSYGAEALSVPEGVGRVQAVRANASAIYLYGQTEAEEDTGTIYALDYDGELLWSHTDLLEEGGSSITRVCDFWPDENGLWLIAETYGVEKTAGDDAYMRTRLLHVSAAGDGVDREAAIDFLPSEPVSWAVDTQRQCAYLVCVDPDSMASSLFTVDYRGELLFEVADAYLSQLCLTADGRLVVCQSVNGQTVIRALDYEAKAWGAAYMLDGGIGRLYGGTACDLYFVDGEYKTLYGVELEDGVCTPLLDLLDYGAGTDILFFTDLGEDGYLLAAGDTIERLYLSDGPGETETAVLTLATFEYLMMSQAVVEFNSAQSEYRIEIKDYSEYNADGDDTAGLNQLNLDIASGDAPDIYDLQSIPVSQFIRLGLLENLNPYLDADPEIDRADYMESLLSAMEIDGGLYCLMPHVCVISLAIDPDRLAGEETLSFAQMLEIADGSDPFGGYLTRYDFIQYMLAGSQSPFVDWAGGSCHFDSEEFICLLELASLLPASREEMYAVQGTMPVELFLEQVCYDLTYASETLGCLDGDGGCAAFVGTPGTDGMNYLLTPSQYVWGMSSLSESKDGAWAFIRYYLQEEFQGSNGMPLLRSCWDSWRESYEGENGSDVYYAALEALLGKASGIYEENTALMEIIMDEAGAYFAGDRTAEDAAKNIQSRVGLYMAEQG